MPWPLRLSLAASTAVVTFALFFAVYCALYVRDALDAGALSNPHIDCLTERDSAALAAGPNQQLADWWVRANIQLYKTGGGRSSDWYLHGLVTMTGLSLTTSPEDRMALSYRKMSFMPICGQPLRRLQPSPPTGVVPLT